MIAVGYIRRSKKSEVRTVSLEEQEAQIRAYCLHRGFELREVVCHDGVSGTKRTRFAEIDERLRATKAVALVVYNLDRLGRDVAGLMDYLRNLQRGVLVYEVGAGPVNINNPREKIVVGVRGLMDEFFVDMVKEKTRDALRHRREQGRRYTRIAPFGFKWAGGKLESEPSEQAFLPLILNCISRKLGARKTRRELLSAGYRGRCSLGLLHKLLQNPPACLPGGPG